MVWFFLGLFLLGIALKYSDRILPRKILGAKGGPIYARPCSGCNAEIRYRISGNYDFVACDLCGAENFVANPRIDASLLASLTELEALLPPEHRLFDFFIHTYLISCLAIAKSDGEISRIEGDYILRKLHNFLGEKGDRALIEQVYQKAAGHFERFPELSAIEFTLVYEVWHALQFISKSLPEEPARELIEFLLKSVFETAYADEILHPNEESLLREFAGRLGFDERGFQMRLASAKAYVSAKNAYDKFTGRKAAESLQSVYAFFSVTPESSREEIKKAYYALAKQYHPDKYHHLPEQIRASAEEKFKEIQKQYELLLQRAP